MISRKKDSESPANSARTDWKNQAARVKNFSMDEYDRREFLSLSLPGFLGVVAALPSLCALATRANASSGRLPAGEKMHWDAFLEAVAKKASEQHLDAWNQDSYVKSIASIASRLHLGDPVLKDALDQLAVRLKNSKVDFKYLEKTRQLLPLPPPVRQRRNHPPTRPPRHDRHDPLRLR